MQRFHDQQPAEVGHEVHLGVQGVTQECRAVRFLLHPIGVSALQALRETLGNELKFHSASGLVSYAAIADRAMTTDTPNSQRFVESQRWPSAMRPQAIVGAAQRVEEPTDLGWQDVQSALVLIADAHASYSVVSRNPATCSPVEGRAAAQGFANSMCRRAQAPTRAEDRLTARPRRRVQARISWRAHRGNLMHGV